MTERFPADTELQQAWDAYLDAYDLAHKSRNIQDGIVVGKLWRRWVELFDGRRHAAADAGNVIHAEELFRSVPMRGAQ